MKNALIFILLPVVIIILVIVFIQYKNERQANENLKTAIADKQSKDVNAIQTAILSSIPLV